MEVFFEQLINISLLLIILPISIFSYRLVEQKLNIRDSQPSFPQEAQPLSRRSPQEDTYEKDEI